MQLLNSALLTYLIIIVARVGLSTFYVKTDPKRMLLLNNWYTTIPGHFFAMCMFIFHKTEVQRVILICLMGLNCNWFKSYGLKCILRLNATLANSHQLINGHFMTITGHFLANFKFIFHKTEVQTVVLRCWPSLNLNWNKFYNLKSKKANI